MRKTERELLKVEKMLEDEPFRYDLLQERIKLSLELNEIERVMIAFEDMAQKVPMGIDLWKLWESILSDESIHENFKERYALDEIYKRGCEEYYDAEFWLMRVNGEEFDEYEAACMTIGRDFRYAKQFWELILENEGENGVTLVEDIVCIPFRGFEEFIVKCSSMYPDLKVSSEKIMSTLKWCDGLESMETAIEESDSAETWISLLQNAKHISKDPYVIMNYYERLVTKYFANPRVWLVYLEFSRGFIGAAETLKVTERAVRNCPQTVELWMYRMDMLEMMGGNVGKVFNQILESGITGESLLLVCCSYGMHLHRIGKNDEDAFVRLAKIVAELLESIDIISEHSVESLSNIIRAVRSDSFVKPISQYFERHLELWKVWFDEDICDASVEKKREMFRNALSRQDVNSRIGRYPLLNLWKRMEERHGDIKVLMDVKQKMQNEVWKFYELNEEKTVDKKKAGKRTTIDEDNVKKTKKARVEKVQETKRDETPQPKTAFVVNIPRDIGEDDITEIFSPHGKVTAVRILKNSLGRSRGMCYVDYEEEKCVDTAIAALHRSKVGDQVIQVKRSLPHSSQLPASIEKSVFVKNLGKVDEDELKTELSRVFESVGAIVDIRVLLDRVDGRSRGAAFIDFEDSSSVPKALSLTNTDFMGSRMKVQRVKPVMKQKERKTMSNKDFQNMFKKS